MLPTKKAGARSLADVLPDSVAALRGEGSTLNLPEADSAIVVLVDGLGASLLSANSGHARTLNAQPRTTISSVFPSTTAAALTTFTTGVHPGIHGLVGYRTRDVANDRLVNQLSGWDEQMRPDTWQRSRTVFEKAADQGIRSYAVGPALYRTSGFTAAILRGAEYRGAESLSDRFSLAAELARQPGTLVYLYIPELDKTAHHDGCDSHKWLHRLEALDAAVRQALTQLPPRVGMLITADHGCLDVPAHSQILFDRVPELVAGIRHVGGEPRCLQLYLDPTATPEQVEENAQAWRDHESERAWVLTRVEAIEAGLFGDVDPAVEDRIGDVIVAARKRVVYYDSRPADQSSRRMIGQHGSLTPEETTVPLIRCGEFAS